MLYCLNARGTTRWSLLKRHVAALNFSHRGQVFQLGRSNLEEAERSFFTAMMNVYVQAGRMDDALVIYEDMLVEGLSADIRVFNILLQGYTKQVPCDVLYPSYVFRGMEIVLSRLKTLSQNWDSKWIPTLIISSFPDI